MKNEVISFEESKIRKIWHDEQWYFSVIDVIGILTESPDPKRYWSVLKVRETQLITVCSPLKLTATDGKQRATDCATTEGVFRTIMSLPSPKTEPLKMWLVQVGKEKLDEINDPELGLERLKENYKLKGYNILLKLNSPNYAYFD